MKSKILSSLLLAFAFFVVTISASAQNVTVTAPNQLAFLNSSFSVPVTVSDTTGLGIISYDVRVTYDPSVLELQATPVDTTGTISNGMVITPNPSTPGLLRISAFTAFDLVGGGTLFNLQFKAIGPAGSVSPIHWEFFMFNEGTPSNTATDGSVRILQAPTAGEASISGRVVSSAGRPISNAIVKVSAVDGNQMTVRTNQFGAYRFEGLTAGHSYALEASAKGYRFVPRLIQLNDSIGNIQIVAER
jgi:hypothetical protein